MKKIFSFMLVAVAMFTFTACDNTADMSDAELEQAIIKHSESGFIGKIEVKDKEDAELADFDGQYMSANFDADHKFALYFGEKKKDVKAKNISPEDAFWTGEWKVVDGILWVTDDEDSGEDLGKWYDVFVISKEGKRITYDGLFKVVLD